MGIKKTDSTKQIVEVFCKNIYKLHGFPKIIVSDRNAKFTSSFWKEFCKQIGSTLNMSSSYHPQTYGQKEVVNKCLEAYLRSFVTDKQNRWLHWLHLAEWWYNSTYHTSAIRSQDDTFSSNIWLFTARWKEFVQGDEKDLH